MTLTAALTVLFVALKMLGKIDWSWWIVTAPTWGALLAWLSCSLYVIYLGEKKK